MPDIETVRSFHTGKTVKNIKSIFSFFEGKLTLTINIYTRRKG